MNQFLGRNECEILTHSQQQQQQQQAPNAHKKESTVRLTTRITMLWVLVATKSVFQCAL